MDRNWRCRQGELDLVLRRGRTIVFCEVKTRSGTAFGEPVEAVGAVKQARLRRLAGRWLSENRARVGAAPSELRFDVAALLAGHPGSGPGAGFPATVLPCRRPRPAPPL